MKTRFFNSLLVVTLRAIFNNFNAEHGIRIRYRMEAHFRLCMWTRGEPFLPRLDAGMRDWARRSDTVKASVQQADVDRTKTIEQAFVNTGYAAKAARIRARALYFIQIGYCEATIPAISLRTYNFLPGVGINFVF